MSFKFKRLFTVIIIALLALLDNLYSGALQIADCIVLMYVTIPSALLLVGCHAPCPSQSTCGYKIMDFNLGRLLPLSCRDW